MADETKTKTKTKKPDGPAAGDRFGARWVKRAAGRQVNQLELLRHDQIVAWGPDGTGWVEPLDAKAFKKAQAELEAKLAAQSGGTMTGSSEAES